MKLVNREQVTHIIAFRETEGVWDNRWGYWKKMLYVPYREHKWWEAGKETKEGYYENGFNGSFNSYLSIKDVIYDSDKWFIRDDSVWTYSFIQIFCGESLVHREYFRTFVELEKHLGDNYNNCNIRYEK